MLQKRVSMLKPSVHGRFWSMNLWCSPHVLASACHWGICCKSWIQVQVHPKCLKIKKDIEAMSYDSYEPRLHMLYPLFPIRFGSSGSTKRTTAERCFCVQHLLAPTVMQATLATAGTAQALNTAVPKSVLFFSDMGQVYYFAAHPGQVPCNSKRGLDSVFFKPYFCVHSLTHSMTPRISVLAVDVDTLRVQIHLAVALPNRGVEYNKWNRMISDEDCKNWVRLYNRHKDPQPTKHSKKYKISVHVIDTALLVKKIFILRSAPVKRSLWQARSTLCS